MEQQDNGLCATATDEDGNTVSITLQEEKTACQNVERQRENLKSIFMKSGNTIFSVTDVKLDCGIYFIPAGKITQWRRDLLDLLTEERERQREKSTMLFPKTTHPYPIPVLDYKGNIHNKKAEEFYHLHQVRETAPSFENEQPANVPVMTCKHCLRYALGYCKKQDKNANDIKEPLTLTANDGKEYRLEFDCNACEMKIIAQQ